MTDNKCWICGQEANSGEHYIKASDLRSIFGKITSRRPLFTKKDGNHIKIPGIKSDKLKYNVKLCSECNNNLTSKYDKAWEKLSLYLRERRPIVKENSVVKLRRIFPGEVKKSMLYVHLFFIKQFGCIAKEHAVPIDTKAFATCIKNVEPHPHFWISFWGGVNTDIARRAVITPVTVVNFAGIVAYATWLYVVGPIAVNVVYSVPFQAIPGTKYAWHPNFVGNQITVAASGSWGK